MIPVQILISEQYISEN